MFGFARSGFGCSLQVFWRCAMVRRSLLLTSMLWASIRSTRHPPAKRCAQCACVSVCLCVCVSGMGLSPLSASWWSWDSSMTTLHSCSFNTHTHSLSLSTFLSRPLSCYAQVWTSVKAWRKQGGAGVLSSLVSSGNPKTKRAK